MAVRLFFRTVGGLIEPKSVPLDKTVAEMKELVAPGQAIHLFYQNRKLKDDAVISDLDLQPQSCVVVVEARSASTSPQRIAPTEGTAAPTEAQIRQAISRSPIQRTQQEPTPAARPFRPLEARNFRQQLRELVHTLANIGSSIQQRSQPAAPEARPPEANLDIAARANIPNLRTAPLVVDNESLEQLTGMGYSEAVARKALTLNRMSPMLALDWLLQHEDEPDLAEPLTEQQQQRIIARAARDTFEPNPAAFEQLRDMGFNKYDIVAALRSTQNDQETACSWLLGDRDTSSLLDADADETPGIMPPDHPVIQAILANPRIQAGLGNPRVIEALHAIANNPAVAADMYLDPEIGRVLMEIWEISVQNRDAFASPVPHAAATPPPPPPPASANGNAQTNGDID